MKTGMGRVINELAWTGIYIVFLLLTISYSATFRQLINKEYLAFPSLISMLVIPILFGILLGIPALVERRTKSGNFDWLKLFIQGLPALMLSVPFIVFATTSLNSMGFEHLSRSYLDMYAPTAFIIYLAGVWFGKVFVDCIKSGQ